MTGKQSNNEYQSQTATPPPSNPDYLPAFSATAEPQQLAPNSSNYGCPYRSSAVGTNMTHTQTYHATGETAPLVPPPYEDFNNPTRVYLTTGPGYKPQLLFCPSCSKNVMTETAHTAGNFAWASSLVLCFFGWWICAPLPLVLDSCNDVKHMCPNCKTVIAERQRMS
ncbi:hypothetical protein SARC_01598, partial [Sphaeroforma arctica JP610]